MRERKTLLMLTITLLLGAAIASTTPVVKAQTVEFYVKMDDGSIPPVPPGELLTVEIWIDSPPDAAIIGWGISFAVNPNALTIGYFVSSPPPGYWLYTAEGTFLSDWTTGYPWPKGVACIDGAYNQTAGTIEQYACMVAAWKGLPDGVGANGTGLLCYIYLTSKALIESPLDITMAKYFTTEGEYDADVITDGLYCFCCTPEFPSGTEAAATIGLTAVVAYVWLRKHKTKPTIAKRFTTQTSQ